MMKRGKLSNEERQTIIEEVKKGTPTDKIASVINRTVAPVRRFIKDHNLVHETEMDKRQKGLSYLKEKLHNREYWPNIKASLTSDELEYFENLWVELVLQFREDVMFTEELQIKQLIYVDILINRCMIERKRHAEEIDKLDKLIQDEYQKDEADQDKNFLTSLETQLSYARNSLGSYTAEHSKLLDKQRSIHSDLKATRDQRLKRVEDAKTSFASWLRQLEEEDTRERIGENIEYMRLAMDKSSAELAEWHTYVDGQLDQPLLNAETVKDE